MSKPVTSKLYCRPVFKVANVEESIKHYREVLGFEQNWIYPFEGEDAKICGQVSRGEMEIIVWVAADIASPGRLYIVLHEEDQLDALHDEIAGKGGKVTKAPGEQPWAKYGFVVEDIDSNQLFFCGAGESQ